MKRQHCRQLWHCRWLKTDNNHTATILSISTNSTITALLLSLHDSARFTQSVQRSQSSPDSFGLGDNLTFHAKDVFPGVAVQPVCCATKQKQIGSSVFSASFGFDDLKTKHLVGLEWIQWSHLFWTNPNNTYHTLTLKIPTYSLETVLPLTASIHLTAATWTTTAWRATSMENVSSMSLQHLEACWL